MQTVHPLFQLPLSLALLAAISGCASQPGTTSASGPEKGLVCTRETPIGSLMATTTCRSAEQIEAEKKAAETLTNGVRSPSNGGSTRAGGM